MNAKSINKLLLTNKNNNLVKEILASNKIVSESFLELAISNRSLDMVSFLLEHGHWSNRCLFVLCEYYDKPIYNKLIYHTTKQDIKNTIVISDKIKEQMQRDCYIIYGKRMNILNRIFLSDVSRTILDFIT